MPEIPTRFQLLGPLDRGSLAQGSIAQDHLGRGARVFHVHDLVLRRDVALTLYPDLTTPGALERAREETRTMARVSAHEAVVTIFDVIERERCLWLVSEYLSGGSLRERLLEGALPIPRAVHIALRIASALDYAHARDLVHADLRPERVLFDAQGRAYVTDFGLTSATPTTRSSPRYTAPEQIEGECSPQSDLYSLGCVLYEMLTGRTPCADVGGSAGDPERSRAPAPPAALEPAIPPALDRLCMALLAERASQRPESAARVLEVLQRATTSSPRGAEIACGGARDRRIGPETETFVAREQERTRAEGWLAERTARFVLIEGDAGIGKTALVERLAAYAMVQGFEVWTAAAAETPSAPLAPLRELLLPGRGRLATRAPLAGRLWSDGDRAPSEEDSDSFLYGLATELVGLPSEAPLLLILEDLHRADPATLRFLDHLHALLPSGESSLVVLGSLRPPPRDSELDAYVTAWTRLDTTRSLALTALDSSQTHALVEQLSGLTPSGPLLELLVEVGGGTPQFIRELLAHLDATGRLEEREGQLWTSVDADHLDLPRSLQTVISGLLGGLAAEVRDTVRVAACLGQGFPTALLAEVVEIGASDLLRHLATLERARILEGQGQRYVFRHPLMRYALYEEVSAEARARTHARLEGALPARQGRAISGDRDAG